ncbi:MAG: 30S ribosomal protein S4e [Candidatus Lokiarchaeota archaeon]|nr:30S ribosomal protein S4e [Candidatus Lokiarchaeota archaeon]MBD3200761.1 30S ribosomal protein S4e [Candidatus Lokiarchaeota archaeon]
MTRHAGQKRLKRLNTPKYLQIKRKHGKFFVNPSPGPHPKRFCLPLLHIVRDLLKIVETNREAKKIIGRGFFKVDGKIVKDTKYPIGLMDVLTIDKMEKHYRILPDSKHGLILNEISNSESEYKLCRINGKKTIKGGNLQLNLHDGRNILIEVKNPKSPEEDTYKRMDVLKISLPEQEILKQIEFKEGNLGLIMDGANIGQMGEITQIRKRFGPKASTVTIQHDSVETETLYDYTFIVGEDEPEIELPQINE